MQWFNKLKIGARLGAGFSFVLALLALIASVSIFRISDLNTEIGKVVDGDLPKVVIANNLVDNARMVSGAVRNMILSNDKKVEQDQLDIIAKARKDNNTLYDRMQALVNSEQGKQLLGKVLDQRPKFSAATDKLLTMADSSSAQHDAAKAAAFLFAEFGPIEKSYVDALNAIADHQEDAAKERGKSAVDTAAAARVLVATLAAVAFVLAIGLAWWITGSITAPIHQAVRVAETVAAGDLTSHIDVSRQDETGHLLQALQKMNVRLVDIVGQVRQSSDSIATGSTQIAAGNVDLSQRTEEQASNLEETAASMEQLTSAVRTNADTSNQAARLATAAAQAATEGGMVVGKVVQTMEAIAQSSKKISDIIGVIDGIAFQTNILALNAAVEAARAGEQGRGFAVVASEVRTLAQRSADAAKEIKALIGNSVEKVDAGTRQVHEAGKSVENIVEQVNHVTQLIAEISSATSEQSAGIAQVGDAVNQLDQVTQQNAALVEESAAAADSLKHQAATLAEVVNVFKLTQTGMTTSPAHRPVVQKSAGHATLPHKPIRPVTLSKPKAISAAKPALTTAPRPALAAPIGEDASEWETF